MVFFISTQFFLETFIRNSEEPDQMPRFAVSDLVCRCPTKRTLGLYGLIVFMLSSNCNCSMAFLCGAVGWYVEYVYGISWSNLITF